MDSETKAECRMRETIVENTANTRAAAKADATQKLGGMFTSLRARLFLLVLMAILPALFLVF